MRVSSEALCEDLLAHSVTTIHPRFLKVLEEYVLGRKSGYLSPRQAPSNLNQKSIYGFLSTFYDKYPRNGYKN